MLVKKEVIRNGVVYQIPCKDCQGSYVGQTKRSLSVQIKEHQRAVFNGTKETSALAESALTTGHNIDWNNVSVLVSCGQATKN